jgi:hypothetical protein
MGIEILAHIVVPLMAGVVFLLFVAATEPEPIAWNNCIDIGLDLTLLGLGRGGMERVRQHSRSTTERLPCENLL